MNRLNDLARVRDEDLAGRASGAGARALLASITAEEPTIVGHRTRRPIWGSRRFLASAVAVAGLAAVAVIVPAALGPATSYASSAIDIQLRGDHYVAVIKDPLAEYAEYTKGFKAVGLDVRLEPVPASPTAVGEVTGMSGSFAGVDHPNQDRTIGSDTEPAGCDLGKPGCAMTIMVSRDYDAHAVIRLGRVAQPGEKYQNARPATSRGEMLEGFRADEKTVGEVLTEARKRGLKAVYEVITPEPDNNGWRVEPDKQSAEVGDDWIVWEAESEQAGVLRLLVTKERLPKNPIYAGPKPAGFID
ncbi:hypothetical protein SAMN05444920_101143 [Nonomuraea solani]|uniref:Uncharacterized protein n=1 Tax=Nonomuraea solani TaxID=1144553 RepID=A0A1H5T815_9ACTN|nr:hypothetical protein [Nonomuraea solani]SEF58930.1 hypothetical protein SAMN05444920_101143 [Nonomuraea solani]